MSNGGARLAPPRRGDMILEVAGLTMRFGGLTAVDSVSFVAERGEITALIGPNGAGKTTVFNCITGFYRASEGAIRLHVPGALPIELHTLAGHRIARAGVARSFQNIRLFPGMTALENLLIAQHNTLMAATGWGIGAVLGLSRYPRAEKRGDRQGPPLARRHPPDRTRRRPRRRAPLRRAAALGDRPRHVHRALAALPRRARGRPQPARVGRAGAACSGKSAPAAPPSCSSSTTWAS